MWLRLVHHSICMNRIFTCRQVRTDDNNSLLCKLLTCLAAVSPHQNYRDDKYTNNNNNHLLQYKMKYLFHDHKWFPREPLWKLIGGEMM